MSEGTQATSTRNQGTTNTAPSRKRNWWQVLFLLVPFLRGFSAYT